MSNNQTNDDDYLDHLAQILPWDRTFTALERFLIVIIVSTFVSLVGCILLCLIIPRSPLRRRYARQKKNQLERHPLTALPARNSIIVVPPPPPTYESLAQSASLLDLNRLHNGHYLHSVRKSSNGTVSDTDSITSNKNDRISPFDSKGLRSQSARSSFSSVGPLATISNTFPLAPYAQFNMNLTIDTDANLLTIQLNNAEHMFAHPAFDEQGDYLIRTQLINTTTWKKYQEAWRKRRSSLSLNAWKKQQEKQTKTLARTKNNTLICDEIIKFAFNKNELSFIALRFLLCCIERSGLEDVMFESMIPLNGSMIPQHEQAVEFKELPQIKFAEVFLGFGYLPTSERFTLTITKFRHFFKLERGNVLPTRLIITGFHHGRRFLQKKVSFNLEESKSYEFDMNETISQNIPVNDIQSIYVHLQFQSKTDRSLLPSMSILLGRQTSYESEWQKLLDQPRQTHFGWYPFLG